MDYDSRYSCRAELIMRSRRVSATQLSICRLLRRALRLFCSDFSACKDEVTLAA
jgi:hypothetical protein